MRSLVLQWLLVMGTLIGVAQGVTVYMSVQPDGCYVTSQGDVLQLLVHYPHSYLVANGDTILHSSGQNGEGMVFRYRAADKRDQGVVLVDRKTADGKWETGAFDLDGLCLIDFKARCWDITRKRGKDGKVVMQQQFLP